MSSSSNDPDSPEEYEQEFKRSSSVPVGIILGIVALSVTLFFALTLPKCSSRDEPAAVAATSAEPSGQGQTSRPSAPAAGATPASASSKAPVADPASSPRETTPSPGRTEVYSDPRKLLSAFATRIKEGKLDSALDLVGDEALQEHGGARLRTLFTQGKYEIAAENPVSEIGYRDNLTRFGLKVTRKAQGALPADEKSVFFDMLRKADSTWFVDKVHLPAFTALASPVAAAGAAPAGLPDSVRAPGPAEGTMLVLGDAAAGETSDPLQLAHAFVTAVTALDFEKAKSLLDLDKITEEKLAGLLIVSEESGMVLRSAQPLVATATEDDRAWVIAQLEAGGAPSFFGLEIAADPENPGHWKISGLNFSKLIADQAAAAGGDAITYTPIVESPQGGDSLVLYFEYDVGELHGRSRRQLDIIARIMRGDPSKKIHISGHADAMGTEDYNATLSDTRAAEVKRGLIAAGVRPAQIVTEAFGESKPLSPNVNPDGSDNPTGRKRNRRAEVYLDF